MGNTTRVREFIHGVSTTLMDTTPQYSRWPEVEIVRYINYGQRAITAYLPQAGARVDVVKLLPGTRQDLTKILAANIKPGDGSTATDTYGISLIELRKNMGADGTAAGRVIRPSDRYTKDTSDPDWHTRTASAVREYVFEKNTPKQFEVSPGVTGNVWVELSWMVEPAVLTGGAPGSETFLWDGSNTTLLSISDQYVDVLHNYVVAMALLKGSKNVQNVPKSQLHAAMFTAAINAMATALGSVNPELKTLPFMDQIVQAS
jgi:hypothetical protein